MRVTNKMLANTVLNNISAGLGRLQKLQDQMSTGHKVSRPSQDPVVGSRVMTMQMVLNQHEQYERNINDALSWMDTTERALGSLTDVLQRARELAVAGANDVLSQTERDAIAREVEQLIDMVVQVANTNHAGRYVFAGTATTAPPFDQNGAYSGNLSGLEWEISQGVAIQFNINGQEAFIDAGVFTALNDLVVSLQTGDTNNISNVTLGLLDSAITDTLSHRSSLGAKSNRLEMAQDRSHIETINYKQLLSRLNDVDMAKIYTDFMMQEAVYQSALNTGARILQPTLLNFLR